MRSKTAAVIVLTAFMSICIQANAQDDWANLGRYAQANSEVTVQPKAVFMGDSITQCWWDADPNFFTSNNFLCRGISGQTTSHMLVRMRKDVVDLHPKYVVILAGTNDIAKNNGFIEVDDIYGNIVSMCEIAKANKIKPVICSVLPVKQYRWRPEVTDCADRIIRLNSLLKEYAQIAAMGWMAFGLSVSALRRICIFALLSMALGGIALGMGTDNIWSLIAAAVGLLLVCAFGFRQRPGSVAYLPVELRYGQKLLRLTALRDTGNSLVDPVTGRSVLVVDANAAIALTGLTLQQLQKPVEAVSNALLPGLRLISYQAVGQPGGMLLALRIPDVRIGDWKGSSLVAFAPNGLSREGAYQALTGGVA